ncbi:hypothetical protein FA95DRAFT_1579387 [Auriscalpium vulgare]|uniref:Uncharacterized protein n=1 Tax=Auriscalpium vulgare TaxID=40419 RepID=A0ACB8SB89_9AGAM|nr:hypothetical protein FA95DRAFT_1579387 [Auriscalpium vulgare]
MADSFADLWNSTAPTKPAQPPPKLGSAPSQSSGTRRPQYDAFSMLAAASSASPSPRAVTPASIGKTPSPNHGTRSSVAPSGDAFGSLLSGTFGGGSSNANLTIAERAARAEAERQAAHVQRQQAAKQQSTAWQGLDALASAPKLSTSPAPPPDDDWLFGSAPPVQSATNSSVAADDLLASPPKNRSSSPHLDDDWLFGSAPPTKAAAPAPKPHVAQEDDGWGLDEFVSRPKQRPSRSSPPSNTKSLFDHFDAESEPAAPVPSRPATRGSVLSRSNTPGDFDFGDRENALLDDDSDDADDILGNLSRPVDDAPRRPSAPPSGRQSRAPSPPPHVIGQIVEMGFTPQQARVALAATETGLDVQAALETLLSNGAASTPEPSESRRPQRQSARRRERYDESDDERSHARTEGQRRRSSASTRPPGDSPPAGAQNYQQQADKIIAQASEIGLNVFSKANAFWKEGKTRVQKAYEERAASSRSNSAGARADGRPRWMQEALDRDEAAQRERRESEPSDEIIPPKPSQPRRPKPETQAAHVPEVKTGDLFSDDSPKAYVSPYRRGKPVSAQPSSSASTLALRSSSPPRLIQRKTVSAAKHAIATSAKHKASGTEMFKLGRYAEAEAAYSAAISQLPDSHLLLVPLLNNRALTRIKTGDASGAIEDCTTVIGIIGASYHPAKEAKVTSESDGAGVDLADALVKARRRRAEAYEGKEKWDLARQDWESVSGLDFAGRQRSEAASGAARCRKMLTANADGPSTSAPAQPRPAKPAARPPPRRGPTPPSEAVNRLKQANKDAEAEDQLRFELKDSVDARLGAWKKGKETNIRALVASLDTVLWPELGLQKVGMAELVTPNQVKIRYTKAIAKLHPDKLNANNTTLEQRMIANGVFGALNEAWIAFKP